MSKNSIVVSSVECEESSKVLRRFPYDCWSCIIEFLDSHDDFLNLMTTVKGLYEYIKVVTKGIHLSHLPFRLQSFPHESNLIDHVNCLVLYADEYSTIDWLCTSLNEKSVFCLIKKVLKRFTSLHHLMIQFLERSGGYHFDLFVGEVEDDQVHTSLRELTIAVSNRRILRIDTNLFPELRVLRILDCGGTRSHDFRRDPTGEEEDIILSSSSSSDGDEMEENIEDTLAKEFEKWNRRVTSVPRESPPIDNSPEPTLSSSEEEGLTSEYERTRRKMEEDREIFEKIFLDPLDSPIRKLPVLEVAWNRFRKLNTLRLQGWRIIREKYSILELLGTSSNLNHMTLSNVFDPCFHYYQSLQQQPSQNYNNVQSLEICSLSMNYFDLFCPFYSPLCCFQNLRRIELRVMPKSSRIVQFFGLKANDCFSENFHPRHNIVVDQDYLTSIENLVNLETIIFSFFGNNISMEMEGIDLKEATETYFWIRNLPSLKNLHLEAVVGLPICISNTPQLSNLEIVYKSVQQSVIDRISVEQVSKSLKKLSNVNISFISSSSSNSSVNNNKSNNNVIESFINNLTDFEDLKNVNLSLPNFELGEALVREFSRYKPKFEKEEVIHQVYEEFCLNFERNSEPETQLKWFEFQNINPSIRFKNLKISNRKDIRVQNVVIQRRLELLFCGNVDLKNLNHTKTVVYNRLSEGECKINIRNCSSLNTLEIGSSRCENEKDKLTISLGGHLPSLKKLKVEKRVLRSISKISIDDDVSSSSSPFEQLENIMDYDDNNNERRRRRGRKRKKNKRKRMIMDYEIENVDLRVPSVFQEITQQVRIVADSNNTLKVGMNRLIFRIFHRNQKNKTWRKLKQIIIEGFFIDLKNDNSEDVGEEFLEDFVEGLKSDGGVEVKFVDCSFSNDLKSDDVEDVDSLDSDSFDSLDSDSDDERRRKYEERSIKREIDDAILGVNLYDSDEII